ncbi:MAG: peptidylprolyl isomerase [Syntrophales bacterium]|nr:peptidylprolyl isomerase [Syntrophales bacterium]
MLLSLIKTNERKGWVTMRKWFFLLLFMTTIIIFAPMVRAAIVDRIVAVVNEDIITLSELKEAFAPYRERLERSTPESERPRATEEAMRFLLDRLINNKLIEQQARKKGIVVREDEVMNYISRLLESKKITLADFIKSLEEAGTNLERYKEELRADMLRNRLIRREIQTKIVVSDEEIGEYYKKHREDYEGKEAIRLKQILIPVEPGTKEEKIEELKKLAEGIRQRLEKGEPFDIIAEQVVPGTSSLAGGDLGFIERGHMHAEVEEVAFSLPIGKISPVIRSPAGFHILLVTEKKGAGIKPLSEVRMEILQKIEEKKMIERFDQWIETYRKMSIIEIRFP